MIKDWIEAIRLRTLPLAIASIGMGGILAYADGGFKLRVLLLCISTTVTLQILSNLANDYGDSVHGADSVDREGPLRVVQQGAISKNAMRIAIILTAILSLISGIFLLQESALNTSVFWMFLALGILAIAAAVLYTNGYRPYGYEGFGDISVFLFFGILAVGGTYYLQTGKIDPLILLPATSIGCFTVAVLNVNNIRDIESDKAAGKYSIPVRLGRARAVIYHGLLLFTGMISAFVFQWIKGAPLPGYLFLLTIPLFVQNFIAVKSKLKASALDPYLKRLALSTLAFVVLFGFSVM
ncbi:MAG: 1,4-dihydroxy-2-naphthoate polyprenyltransferase [Saprospiraceae bacterium]|nr:1,4-dihydroxy-2-naphthoate polyprenyltransferase [Saprospiraceae bacterium]